MDRNGLAAAVTLAEVIAFEHARNRAARCQLDHIGAVLVAHPFGIEHNLGLFTIQDFENLFLVGSGILVHFSLRERWPGCALAGRIADHAGEVTNQEQHLVTQVLELLELVDQYRVTKMQVGRGRIKPGLDSQRMPLLQLLNKLFFDKYFVGASADNI